MCFSRAMLLDKTKCRHSLGHLVVSPDAISSLSSMYHIPKSVTLVLPHVGYDPTELEEGDLLLPLCAFDQGNKSASTLGQFYLKCTHPAGNPIPPGKKSKGDWKMKWVIARGSWARTVLMQQEKPRLLDTSSSFEEKIARVVGHKGKSEGRKDVTDPSRLVGDSLVNLFVVVYREGFVITTNKHPPKTSTNKP
ncbi:hypothetical protein QYF36_018462 [Acer negundo]|nr:hypothetical protein QYF36_018462 [Acer negundo]